MTGPPEWGRAVHETIRTRRSVREFTPRPVPRDALERIIEAACWAPNHRLTEPWRFFVLEYGGTMRRAAAALVHDWTLENIPNPSPERRAQSAEEVRREILEAPAFIYVYCVGGDNPEIALENYGAVCCAVQNLQLAAHAEGLAAGWSTGKPTRPPQLAAMLGADPSWQMVGALYVGYPAKIPDMRRRPHTEITTWL